MVSKARTSIMQSRWEEMAWISWTLLLFSCFGVIFSYLFSAPSLIRQLTDQQPISYSPSMPPTHHRAWPMVADAAAQAPPSPQSPLTQKTKQGLCQHHQTTSFQAGKCHSFFWNEQERLWAAECLALCRSRTHPPLPPPLSHPPSQLPTFSPFNTHSLSTQPLSDEKFPARGHGSNGLLKRKAIPYSGWTSSFLSPWGRRVIAQPGREVKNPTIPKACYNVK